MVAILIYGDGRAGREGGWKDRKGVQNQIAPAADIEAPSQPPIIFPNCPFWVELRTLWEKFADVVEYKEAMLALARLLAGKV